MFVEPLTVTINSVAQTFRRTAFGPPGRFQIPDGSLILEIGQSVAKGRERFNARLIRTLVAPDPLNAALMRTYKREYWAGSAGPLNGIGISDAVADQDLAGFNAWYNLPATRASLFGGES